MSAAHIPHPSGRFPRASLRFGTGGQCEVSRLVIATKIVGVDRVVAVRSIPGAFPFNVGDIVEVQANRGLVNHGEVVEVSSDAGQVRIQLPETFLEER